MEIEYLLQNLSNRKYILLNYTWFGDYYKLINSISNESVIRYNYNEKTKHFIELTTVSDSIISVVKIPILSTNIVKEFISKLKHTISFSKYNNDVIALIFDTDSITIRYNYTNKVNPIELNNKDYFSLSSIKKKIEEPIVNTDGFCESGEEENYEIEYEDYKKDNLENFFNKKESKDIVNNDNTINFTFITEESIIIEERDKIFQSINDNIIKNVICYLSIEFENLKDIFRKLGNGRVNVNIYKNNMTLKAIVPKYNKHTTINLTVLHINKDFYEKEINFFINSNAIIKLKSLTNNFNIVSSDNKKIFKKVELKIVVDTSNPEKYIYGITIFPSNFSKKNMINDNIFNIYNSIMLYIPEY